MTSAVLAQQVQGLQAQLECGTSSQSCGATEILSLSIPWCNRQLRWKALLSLLPPCAPDFVFDDDGFQPLLNPSAAQLQHALTAWDAFGDPSQLLTLVKTLLALYRSHQHARLAAISNARLQFELSTLPSHEALELLHVQAADGEPAKACFGVPVEGLDLSQLVSVLASIGKLPAAAAADVAAAAAAGASASSPLPGRGAECPAAAAAAFQQARCGSPGGASPAAASLRSPESGAAATAVGAAGASGASPAHPTSATTITTTPHTSRSPSATVRDCAASLAAGFKLQAAFRIIPDHVTSSPPEPELTLHTPAELAGAIQPIQLPPWTQHMCLMEYMPLVTERVQQAVQQYCQAATARQQLLTSLAGLLGPALELNIPDGCGLFSLTCEGPQHLLLLHVEVGAKFPEDKPALTLQAVRQLTSPEGTKVFRDYPWSPRWSPQEMAARIFNFLRDEAPVFLKLKAPGMAV